MRVVAEKNIDASGLLARSSDSSGFLNTNAKQGPGIWELKSPGMETMPLAGTRASESLAYWESRGGFRIVRFLLILNTVVRELDDCCTDLRNNLLLSGRVLDKQQTTIVSGILYLVSRMT